jgi:DNA invertase Pin-like site-specific DNA recombinase
MHPHSTTTLDPLVAALPLAGRLRPATTVIAGLSYTRVSKSIQTSIPGQQERIVRLARQLEVPVTRELADTGSGMRRNRENYQVLLAEVETGHYSHVLLFKADRLARDSAELQTTIKRLWTLGIKVYDTSVGEITPQNLPVLAMLAEMEIRNLSERTDMGLEQHAKDGSKIGGVPLGYVPGERKGHPDKDAVLAPVIQELFERAERGDAINALRRWFSEASGRPVDNKTIRRILANPYYMGKTVNFRRRDSILHGDYARPHEDWSEAGHDQALVSRERFEGVQARMRLHANVGQAREKRSEYALQGLIWCGRCDRRMHGHTKPPKGIDYRCHVCHFGRGTKKIEQAVRACIGRLQLYAGEAAIVAQEHVDQQRATLEQDIAERGHVIAALTTRRMRLYDRLDSGVIDTEQYKRQVAELDGDWAVAAEEEATLRAKLAALPQLAAFVTDAAARADWMRWPEKIPAMPVPQQQQVYRECCKRVTLDPAANTVTVEYTDHIALLVGDRAHTVQL